jgi:hypothetical protein
MKDRIQKILAAILMMLFILGAMGLVWDYVRREHEIDRLIQEHKQEAKP